MTQRFENAVKAMEENRGIINGSYQLGAGDLMELVDKCFNGSRNDIFNAIAMAYQFGLVMGNRATLAQGLHRI